jgi:hypothetical protein
MLVYLLVPILLILHFVFTFHSLCLSSANNLTTLTSSSKPTPTSYCFRTTVFHLSNANDTHKAHCGIHGLVDDL